MWIIRIILISVTLRKYWLEMEGLFLIMIFSRWFRNMISLRTVKYHLKSSRWWWMLVKGWRNRTAVTKVNKLTMIRIVIRLVCRNDLFISIIISLYIFRFLFWLWWVDRSIKGSGKMCLGLMRHLISRISRISRSSKNSKNKICSNWMSFYSRSEVIVFRTKLKK